jgi:predicted tellurium resistance membrane protein TerC
VPHASFAATIVQVGLLDPIKMLALSFLLLIGMALVADGFGAHVPKGYIYAAIGFSALVEVLNQLTRRRQLRRRAAQKKTAPLPEAKGRRS